MLEHSESEPRGAFSQLASKITCLAEVLDEYFESKGIVPPSLTSAEQPDLPLDDFKVDETRLLLASAGQDMYELALGPEELTENRSYVDKWDVMISKVLADYEVYSAVPLKGSASFAEISAKVGLNESLTTRLLRYATTMRVFQESTPGRISHTAQSAFRVRYPDTVRVERYFQGTDFKMALALPEAIKRYPEIGGPDSVGTQTTVSLALANDKEISYFDWLSSNSEVLEEFHFTMSSLKKNIVGRGITDEELWKNLPQGATVADIGGSTGHNAIMLAKSHPLLNFVVQDLPEVIKESRKQFDASPELEHPRSVKNRIQFLEHNFFEPQKVKAQVYLLRFILHDWSDKDSMTILRNIVSIMEPGSAIVIVDVLMDPTIAIASVRSRRQRAMDLEMMVDLAAKERDLEDWKAIISEVDAKLTIEHVSRLEGSTNSIAMLTVRYV